MRRASSALALTAALGVLAVLPSAARGATTIGIDLAKVLPSTPYDCRAASECTLAPAAFPNQEAVAGAISPVNGTVTAFQLRTGAGGASAVSFRVLRPLVAAATNKQFTGAGTSPMVNAPPYAVTSFPVSMPIRRKDQIGLNCCQSGNDAVSGGALFGSVWGTGGLGPLLDGTTRAPDALAIDRGVMLSATVEPDDSLEILSKPKVRGRKVRMQADVPNPGTVSLSSKNGELLKPSSGYYEVEGAQEISLKLTDSGLALLREGERLRAKIRVSYKPIYADGTVRKKVAAVLKR